MSHQNDPQTNENENHLIGNILAEDNSDSDQEDSSKGFGKLNPFGGAFGLGPNAPFGGAFNNVPDRVGSAPATDLSVVQIVCSYSKIQKYFGQESPQNKKINPFAAAIGAPGFTNLFGGQNEHFTSDPMRRSSGVDYNAGSGVGGVQPIPQDLHLQQQYLATASSQQLGQNNLTAQQQQQLEQVQQFSQDHQFSKGGNASDIYSTKDYYDYYHNLKPRDPRLPKPTYQPSVDLEVFKQIKKAAEIQIKQGSGLVGVGGTPGQPSSEDLENKLAGLTLEEAINQSQGYDNSILMSQQPQSNPNQQQYLQYPNDQAAMMFTQGQNQPQNMFMGSGNTGASGAIGMVNMNQGYIGQGQNNVPQNQLMKSNKKNKNKNYYDGYQQPPQMPPPSKPNKPSQNQTNNQQQLQRFQSYPNNNSNQVQQQQFGSGGGQYMMGTAAYPQQVNQSNPQGYGANNGGMKSPQQQVNNQQQYQGQPYQQQSPMDPFKNMMLQNQMMLAYNQSWPQNQYSQGMTMYQGMGMMPQQYNPMAMQNYMQNPQAMGQYPYGVQMMNPYMVNYQQMYAGGAGGNGQTQGQYPQMSSPMNDRKGGNQMGGNPGGKPGLPKNRGPKPNQMQNRGGDGRSCGDNQNNMGSPQSMGNQIPTIQLPKSEFLEDLRQKIQSGKKIEIKDIKDHVVECAMDQYGSRFIQQKYDVTTPEEKDLIFSEILPEANNLMNDVFGNYVVQKLFEYGTDQQRATLAEQLLGNVLKLTKSMYGCRVVQKALEVISLDQQKLLVSELKDAILDSIYDQNGNHVIQKCIEKMSSESIEFIVQAVIERVPDLCVHTYGCRVIQRILENCSENQTRQILDQILAEIHALTKDQFGNYVIQHVLEHGKSQDDKNKIVKSIKGKVIELSNHKFASNVVEKCLEYGSDKDKKEIIDEFLESNFEDESGYQLNGALYQMMKDRYGNYVIQKCIEVSKGKQREVLLKKITACANVLRKQANYSRHVYNFIEKMSSEGQSQQQQLMGNQMHQQQNQQNVNNYNENSTHYTQGSDSFVDSQQHQQNVQRQIRKKL